MGIVPTSPLRSSLPTGRLFQAADDKATAAGPPSSSISICPSSGGRLRFVDYVTDREWLRGIFAALPTVG